MIENENTGTRNRKTSPTKSWKTYLMISLAVVFIVLGILADKWKTALHLENIEIDGARILPHHLLLSAVKIPMQSLLDTVDLYLIKSRLQKQPFINSVTVTRKYPNALHIELSERQPIASIGSLQPMYIDTAAILLPAIETAVLLDLPIITGVPGMNQMEAGRKLTGKEVRTSIELLQTAVKIDTGLYHLISEINMNSGQDIILTTTDPAVSIIIGRENFLEKLFTLQTFWNQFVRSNNVQDVQHIDLRYKDQVVIKWIKDKKKQKSML